MGLGHRVYKVKDPRATVLQELAENDLRRDEPAEELRSGPGTRTRLTAGILRSEGHLPQRRFLFSGVVYQALGIPTDVFTPIFAIGRVSGWLAHWLEQLQGNRIFRPEQEYIGKADVAYLPLEKRA